MIDTLYARVAEFFHLAQQSQPGAVLCRPGCADCCAVDLTLFPLEAERVRLAFQCLPLRVRQAAADRSRRGEHCALLDPATKRCLVYEARPLICRSHGLAVQAEGRESHCPLNYRDEPPRRENTLVLERINEPLALMNRMAGGTGERIRVAAIVEEEGAKGEG